MSVISNQPAQDIAKLGVNAPNGVVQAIQQASNKSGVDFSYMLHQAKAESSFNPQAKAKTSSATGLYQFIESTWMNMMDKYGQNYGVDTEKMTRSEVLDLRNDAQMASHMAAELAKDNKAYLEREWGGDAGATELYFAHFLGAGKAAGFLNAMDENPMQVASDLFPKAASANRNVFYEPDTGRPRTLAQVYNYFDKKFNTDDKVSPIMIEKNKGSLYQAQTDFRVSQRSGSNIKITKQNRMPIWNLITSPVELMIMADMDLPALHKGKSSKKL